MIFMLLNLDLKKFATEDKKSLNLGAEDNLYLEQFALNVFGKADKQDRSGRADLNTAKTFYAASIFIDILNQFGVLQPDHEQKQKYATWKAMDIRKAIKEGRKPNPGPPVGEENLSTASSAPSGQYVLGPSEAAGLVPRSGSNLVPQCSDDISNKHFTGIPPPSNVHEKFSDQKSNGAPKFSQFYNNFCDQSQDFPPPLRPQSHGAANDGHVSVLTPTSFSSAKNPDQESDSFPPLNESESSGYSQSCPQESDCNAPQDYSSNVPPSLHSFPNFQSHPSFSEISLPSVPHHSPHYQGSERLYSSSQLAPSRPKTQPTSQHAQSSTSSHPRPVPVSAQTNQYDSNYEPPPEKVAEAQKAAKFAVEALASSDVAVAVDYLRKTLELLTNPAAGS